MIKYFNTVLFLLFSLYSLAQLDENNRYMVIGNDTLPFKMKKVQYVTKFGDTNFREVISCPSFYKIEGKISNVLDKNCVKQGDWIERKTSSIASGKYINGRMHGVWKEVFQGENNRAFSLAEYNEDHCLWVKSFYSDSSLYSSIQYGSYDSSYYYIVEKEWYRDGQMMKSVKYKVPSNKSNDSPIEKFAIDTSYEWFPNGVLRYIGINDSTNKSYKYYYQNGNIEVDVVFDSFGVGSGVVKRYYSNGNLEFVKYFLATPQNYNNEFGTWSFYNEKGVMSSQQFYDNGILKKSYTYSDYAFIKVHFLYGSKRKVGHKNGESKWFGGKRGGHVGIEIDSNRVLNFLPFGPFHWFAKSENFSSRYEIHNLEDFWEICGGTSDDVKKSTIVIPISKKQKQKLDSLTIAYMANSPYDYAFLGFRCASAAYEILSQIGIVEKYSHRKIYTRIFYSKILRKRLFKKAKENAWQIHKQDGTSRRKWDKDK